MVLYLAPLLSLAFHLMPRAAPSGSLRRLPGRDCLTCAEFTCPLHLRAGVFPDPEPELPVQNVVSATLAVVLYLAVLGILQAFFFVGPIL